MELDFLYPSEGIHRRWDNGYRITAVAATWDQSALILSIPRRKPGDETQETLRTSQFPSTHVKVWTLFLSKMLKLNARDAFIWTSWKSTNYVTILISSPGFWFYLQEKWAKNLYLASLCYGRTVSWLLFGSLNFCVTFLLSWVSHFVCKNGL